ncbi:hypothetical protein [Rhodopseudomonas sp. B29]|uniref:hypothetical protein n=1 Tax=Rhodopseudomonas sp. B29 TaxID=95607 RepID=UPI0003B5FD18|nr:hypothetical protein [Rhodopseudomonas sp. B29]
MAKNKSESYVGPGLGIVLGALAIIAGAAGIAGPLGALIGLGACMFAIAITAVALSEIRRALSSGANDE